MKTYLILATLLAVVLIIGLTTVYVEEKRVQGEEISRNFRLINQRMSEINLSGQTSSATGSACR